MSGINSLSFFSLAAGSYLLGAVPFGFILVKLVFRQDIRTLGSGNPGATNVWRCFGKGPGMATLSLDVAKGLIPVWAAKTFFPSADMVAIVCGLLAIVGHNWSILLRGSGGKGVATSAGVFLGLLPKELGIALICFLTLLLITKRVSISSMGAALALVAASFFFPNPYYLNLVAILAGLMILVKHIPNIKRMAKGEEPKVRIL